jgi:hypothetical protein
MHGWIGSCFLDSMSMDACMHAAEVWEGNGPCVASLETSCHCFQLAHAGGAPGLQVGQKPAPLKSKVGTPFPKIWNSIEASLCCFQLF